MPGAGLEPARLAAQASKTCVAANYTTPAQTAVEDLRLPFLSIEIRFPVLRRAPDDQKHHKFGEASEIK